MLLWVISYVKILFACLVFVFMTSKSSVTSGNIYVKDASRLLHIEVFLEGLYNVPEQKLNQAHDFINGEPVPMFDDGISDVIIIALHETGDYSEHAWGDLLRYETTAFLESDGNAFATIPEEVNGVSLDGSYWLSIKHRNHLETIYQTPINLSELGPFHCDFITGESMENAALGNNQHYLGQVSRDESTIHAYALFVGDINGDGKININDRSYLNYHLSIGTRGYVPEDLNGDGLITISDRSRLQKNVIHFIESVTPKSKGLGM